jgi:molybdopterin converting factor small subunit
MQVSVRLSAALAQITGLPRVQVDVADDATVSTATAALLVQYPALAPRLKHAVPILAGNHATAADRLAPGQELAFLMPVAGGGTSFLPRRDCLNSHPL